MASFSLWWYLIFFIIEINQVYATIFTVYIVSQVLQDQGHFFFISSNDRSASRVAFFPKPYLYRSASRVAFFPSHLHKDEFKVPFQTQNWYYRSYWQHPVHSAPRALLFICYQCQSRPPGSFVLLPSHLYLQMMGHHLQDPKLSASTQQTPC